jgi:ATP-binding cassette, subfamily F, member 3
MLTFHNVSFARGNKILLNKASLGLFEKQKVGLVGNNGCGKSTLFSLVLGELIPDDGEIQLHNQLRISHLSQELPESDLSALDYVLSGDEEYTLLQKRLSDAESMGKDEELIACHDRLAQIGGYGKPAEAAVILSGLGFDATTHSSSVNQFSGGWRMRLNLARCLMNPADLLLLDEPTNHLDMEAIFWLERWLKQTPAAVLLISHDRDFLDGFATHILHIEQQTTQLYTGNYTRFEQVRAEKLALQQAQHDKQQKNIRHLMSFVERFKAKASKAKQAQSRLKAIEKMDVIAKAQLDSPFSFEFFPCPKAGKPLFQCTAVSAGYEERSPILKGIELSVNPGDRIALLGPNGEGKSTLIKTLTGELPPLSGKISISDSVNIGYFAQHQIDDLDVSLSPLQTIQSLTPGASEQLIRNFLGGFNFQGDMALSTIKYFSGGEKARLALAKLVWLKPNLLLLDEPSNHLDLTMRSAIELALQQYEGALMLITHDRHFLRTTVDEFYLVYDKAVKPFDGDVDDYYQWLQSKAPKKMLATDKKTAEPTLNYRDRKALQNRLKSLDSTIEKLQLQKKSIESELADPALYNSDDSKAKSHTLNQNHGIILQQIMQAESEWLEVIERLD